MPEQRLAKTRRAYEDAVWRRQCDTASVELWKRSNRSFDTDCDPGDEHERRLSAERWRLVEDAGRLERLW